MDYITELKKLLDAETLPLSDPLSELTQTQVELLEAINRKNADVSMQVEEIYDIIKDADENAKEVKNAARRETQALNGLMAMDGLLDDSVRFMRSVGANHAESVAAKSEEILIACGLERIREAGQRFDPNLHTVVSAEYSEIPFESVIRVIESGYIYRGKVLRKATVIISKGSGNS